jgi:hypothetical protein
MTRTSDVVTGLDRVIRYAAMSMFKHESTGILGRPFKAGR